MNTNNLSCGHELRDGCLVREVQHNCLYLTAIAAVNTHLNSWKACDVRELHDQAVNIMNISSRDKSWAIFTWHLRRESANSCSWAVASGRELRVTFSLTHTVWLKHAHLHNKLASISSLREMKEQMRFTSWYHNFSWSIGVFNEKFWSNIKR